MTRRLTSRVRRGLRALQALAAVELNSGDRGAFHPSNGGEDTDAADVRRAIEWLNQLLQKEVKK